MLLKTTVKIIRLDFNRLPYVLPCISTLTFHYKIKDATSGKYLTRLSWAINTMWNYCNDVSMLALRRHHHWLTAFELINLCAGAPQ